MTAIRRLRVLCYNHTGLASGAERILLHTMSALEAANFDVMLAAPEGKLQTLALAQGARYRPIPALQARFTSNPIKLIRHLGSLAGAVSSFRRVVRESAPDVLHANSVRAGIVATLATTGSSLPVVWHVQDDLPKHAISSTIRQLVLRSKRISLIAVSHATARAFQGNHDFQSRLRIIHNGVDLAHYPCKTTAPSLVRQDLGLGPEIPVLCAVGMINRRKGLTGLMSAMRLLVDRRPEVHLLVVGAPTFNRDDLYLAELQDQVKLLGLERSVHFLGTRNDVAAVLRASDLLVLNALVEPFGLVLVESMASGTPVLATRVGGIPEIVEDNENGYLVPSGDHKRLAARLDEVLADAASRQRVAERALLETCPRFSLPRFQEAIATYYRERFSGLTTS